MIIGIDGNEANISDRVGVNTYAFELIKNLAKLQEKDASNHHLIVYLKNEPLSDLPKETQNFKYKVIPGERLWILTRLMPRLLTNPERLDVLFSPSHYTVPISVVPRVASIMDLGYLKFSGQFKKSDYWQLKVWSAISIFVSKAIIAISASTKEDIVRHYPFAKKKTKATLLGYDSSNYNMSISQAEVARVRKKYTIVDDYILYLGTLKPSKNLEGLISAFSMVAKKDKKVSLVIAGKKGWLYESIFERAERLGINDRIVYTGFVDETDKPGLIKGARVFVIPSFWEGFGLDALSAMASGVPVVASNVGSLPEVVGSAGTLVDPYNNSSIAEGLESVLFGSKSKYNEIVSKGLVQVKKFSWESCAKETLEILTNV